MISYLRATFRTHRTDAWYVFPLAVLAVGIPAVAYLTWAAFQGAHYEWGPYLSPVYSTPYVPDWWKFSPAFLLLWIPIGLRATCYYARKAYYRAAFADPLACGVGEKRGTYSGETRFPFVLQNIHRYFLYLALALLALHWTEFFLSLRFEGLWYAGIGTLILFIDTVALTFYVFGCHSLRHIFGGARCFSGAVKHSFWSVISAFNRKHNVWFWISLISVVGADIYVRLLSMGIIAADFHVTF